MKQPNGFHFSEDGSSVRAWQSQYVLGIILLAAFSPGIWIIFARPEKIQGPAWVARLVGALLIFTGVTLLGYYRKAAIDKKGRYEIEWGFFFPWQKISGDTRQIDSVGFGCVRSFDMDTRSFSWRSSVILRASAKDLTFCSSGPAATQSFAKKLAAWLGKPFQASRSVDVTA